MTYSIDDYPNLRASLGKARSDRVRLHTTEGKAEHGKRSRITQNPHRAFLLDTPAHSGGPVDDIITGIASLDSGGSKPLSASRLHNLLQSTEELSTEIIMAGLNVDQRQARRYLVSAKLCITHLNKHRGI